MFKWKIIKFYAHKELISNLMLATSLLCTPNHQRCWILNWILMTCWKVSFLFNPEDAVSMITNKNVKCGLVWPQNSFLLWNTHSQMSLCPHDTMALLDCVQIWLPFCVICWHLQMAQWIVLTYLQRFLVLFLGVFSNVRDTIIPMSAATSSERLKTMRI